MISAGVTRPGVCSGPEENLCVAQQISAGLDNRARGGKYVPATVDIGARSFDAGWRKGETSRAPRVHLQAAKILFDLGPRENASRRCLARPTWHMK